MGIESKVICINQWIRPEYYFPQQGKGDCKICSPGYDNRYCSGYYPVRVYEIKAEEQQNGEITNTRSTGSTGTESKMDG